MPRPGGGGSSEPLNCGSHPQEQRLGEWPSKDLQTKWHPNIGADRDRHRRTVELADRSHAREQRGPQGQQAAIDRDLLGGQQRRGDRSAGRQQHIDAVYLVGDVLDQPAPCLLRGQVCGRGHQRPGLEPRAHLRRVAFTLCLKPAVVGVGSLVSGLDRSGAGDATLLWRNESSEGWLNLWWRPRDTGFHDHDGSCVGVYVIEGRARNEPLVVGRPQRVSEYQAGECFAFPGSGIHRMEHDQGAVTIHVYSPPIRALGHYEVDEGELRRRPVPPDAPSQPSPRLLSAVSAQPPASG